MSYNLNSASQVYFMSLSADGSTYSLKQEAINDLHGWKLEEAKAKLSEVVRLARNQAPQRITVRGEDAVVVISAKEFIKLLPLIKQPNLHKLLSESPLASLDFESQPVQSPVRDIPRNNAFLTSTKAKTTANKPTSNLKNLSSQDFE
ncbi:MAG: type II toxin-antitoxin system prevent-host-death family antitoxin [Cyanobacteria bacterium J06634_6]